MRFSRRVNRSCATVLNITFRLSFPLAQVQDENEESKDMRKNEEAG